MIDPTWKRIAGLHVADDGDISLAWLAHDKESDCITLYDACVFRREVLAVIAEGINARGRWIPIAWQRDAKDLSAELYERGCKMLHDPVENIVERSSADIWERMRSKRLKVDKRLSEWLEEFRRFFQEDAQIPLSGYPFMLATCHAIANLKYAKRQSAKRTPGVNHPKVAII